MPSSPLPPPVSIIIPTWNGRTLLERCLPSVLEAMEAYPGNAEILIVDDASNDDTVKWLTSVDLAVRLIQRPTNGGFAQTVDLGARNAVGSVLVFLNNDVEVNRGFIAPLVEHFSSPDVFIVGACQVAADRKTVVSGPLSGRFKGGLLSFTSVPPMPLDVVSQLHRSAVPTLFASAMACAVSREKYEELGGFDPLYEPYYWEDIDLSYRGWKRGWTILWEPKSLVYSDGGATIRTRFNSRAIRQTVLRNRFIFLWKNISSHRLLLHRHALPLLGRLLRDFVRLDFSLHAALIQALRRLPEILRARYSQKTTTRRCDTEVPVLQSVAD